MKLIDNPFKTNPSTLQDTSGQASSGRYWKILAVITIVAIILTIGGVLLLRTLQPAPSPTPIAQQTPPPTPQQEVLDTSNWQTYRNDEFGFEFKHPHVPLTETIITEDIDDNGGPLSLWFEGQQVGQGQVQGQIVVSRRDTTLSTILDWQLPPGVTLHTAFTKIGAEHYDALEPISGSSVQRAWYVLVNDGTEYQIDIYAVRPEFRNVFDQILSTFRFTR